MINNNEFPLKGINVLPFFLLNTHRQSPAIKDQKEEYMYCFLPAAAVSYSPSLEKDRKVKSTSVLPTYNQNNNVKFNVSFGL